MAASLEAKVAWEQGVVLHGLRGTLRLDSARAGPGPHVVSHAHLDHLRGNAHMSEPTRDFLAARTGLVDATPVPMNKALDLAGWRIALRDAGHCLGAAMVEVGEGELLYTGDFNPAPALTTPAAKPVRCDTLVMESTYGDPRYTLPPRALVVASLEAWLERTLPEAGVALGAYQLGRAQELVALLNRRGIVPSVAQDILPLCDIYRRHGVALEYRAASPDELYGALQPGQCMVVARGLLAKDAPYARHLQEAGGRAAYVSGWCAVYSYFDKYAIDAQFALTDHATFDQLLGFARACGPRRVFTCLGRAEPLAREVARRLGIPATPLG